MLNKRMFVVIIKDDSTSVTYIKNQKIISFFEGNILKQKENFEEFFKQDRFAKLFVLLANKEQEYTAHQFENSSLEEAEKLAKKKLKEGYNESVFRGMIGDSAKLHTYVFITIKINKQIENCFNLLLSIPNYLHNIMAYPLEKKAYNEFASGKDEEPEVNEDIKLSSFISKRDYRYKLYHPTISTLMITEKLNFIMNILLGNGIILMIIIFSILAYYF